LAHVWPKVGDGPNGRRVGRIDCDSVEVGGGVPEASVSVADFVAGDIEDCYAGGWLEVFGPVPVGHGAPGEDCEVVRSGGACFNSSDPAFPFFAMSDSVVA
jgi:hypothetical protein